MAAKLEYDAGMKWLNSATVVAIALAMAATLSLPGEAQINGVPASVTSINFGGKPNPAPGVPASITSLGPNGLQPRNPFFNEPACCINPLFPVSSSPPLFTRHHHRRGHGFPGAGAVYVPYAVPYPVPVEPEDDAGYAAAEDYRGGPTIFDRRGPGTPAAYGGAYAESTKPLSSQEDVASNQPPDASVADQPQTLLIFKDGHTAEVQNYAVVGDTLFDLTPEHRRKIALADLDLGATVKQNEDRGIDFQMPQLSRQANNTAGQTETKK